MARGAAPRQAANQLDELTVHLDAVDLGGDQVLGTLRHARQRGTGVLSFTFDEAWLQGPHAFPIDPRLSAHAGEQHLAELPGVIADTTPDRWGRTLLERDLAKTEGRARTLDAWELLTLVRDDLRLGALRFARADGIFVASAAPSVPPVARLRELEDGVRVVERGGMPDPAVLDLVAPGSPLGGNRPKANFRTVDERLWLAKFPSSTDRWDTGSWEYLLNQLAAEAGIPVPETQRLGPFLSTQHTFAALRFDRIGSGRRLFASALTLTGSRDHGDASYLDVARAIELFGDPSKIGADLEQLFRRVTFNFVVGHRDDHLRNHGFLRETAGWRLAPAYDLNPRPESRAHELAIDEGNREPDLEQVLATAPYYRVSARRAQAVADEVRAAVSPWRERAAQLGLLRPEIDLMDDAFSV